jgi:hypothetical protein
MKVAPIIDYSAVSRLHGQKRLATLLPQWKRRVNVEMSKIPTSISVTVAHEKVLSMIDELRMVSGNAIQMPLRAVFILSETSDINHEAIDPLYLSSLASSLDVPIISDSAEIPDSVLFELWIGDVHHTLYLSTNPSLGIQAITGPSPETRYFQGMNYLLLVRATHTVPIVNAVMEGEDVLTCISLSSPVNTVCVVCPSQSSTILTVERIKKLKPQCVVICEGNDLWYNKDDKTFHGFTYDKCSILSQMYDDIIMSPSFKEKLRAEHRLPRLKTYPHDVFYGSKDIPVPSHIPVQAPCINIPEHNPILEDRLTKIEEILLTISSKLVVPPPSPIRIEAKPNPSIPPPLFAQHASATMPLQIPSTPQNVSFPIPSLFK